MTGYAKSLLDYAKWYGNMTDEQAVKWCDENLAPTWRVHSDQPPAGVTVIGDCDD